MGEKLLEQYMPLRFERDPVLEEPELRPFSPYLMQKGNVKGADKEIRLPGECPSFCGGNHTVPLL